MDVLLETLNLTFSQLIAITVLGVILVVAWFAMRLMFKLTKTLFRIGCGIIFLIVAAVFLLSYVG